MPDMTQETRAFTATELRVDSEGDAPPKIVGYAAVFGSPSVDLGGFTETIKKGAFRAVLKSKPDVRALVNHDPSQVLGRTTAGTLRLKEDTTGLLAEIDPPDTQLGADLMESIKRGDVDQMSFAFRTGEEKWTYTDDDEPDKREIRVVSELFDVSPVTFPAYPDTTVALRSRDANANKCPNCGNARWLAHDLEHGDGKPLWTCNACEATPTGTPNLDHARIRLAEVEQKNT